MANDYTNRRGQVFTHMPSHHLAASNGYVARSKLVAEALLGRDLLPEERVWHEDGDAGNDHPTNLRVFPNQAALAAHRAELYHGSKNPDQREALRGLTEAAKELREQRGTATARRSEAQKRAHAQRRRKHG